MKVSEITEIINKWMPISIAEDFDNVGLLIGCPDSIVKNILVTLDTTLKVIDEAIDNNCNLIISYHPIIFNDLKKVTSDSGYVQKSVIKAVKNNISVYAIHTSLDNHADGISYFLSKKIGLKNTSILIPKKNPDSNLKLGMGVKGELEKPLEESDFFNLLKEKLNLKYLRHSVKLNKKVSKVSIVVGSGSFAINSAISKQADVFLTSDLKYHNFFMAENKIVLMDIGHYESEQFTKNLIFD